MPVIALQDWELAVSTKNETPAWENGVAVGVIILALVVVFAVGLPRWHKHDQSAALTLPDTLSGGYRAVDQLSFAKLPADQQKQTSQAQFDQSIATLKKSATTENTQLANAFGIAVTSREYVSPDFQSEIQTTAYRGPGGIFGTGGNLVDSSTGGAGTATLTRVGDAVCYSDPGNAQQQVGPQAECQRTSGNLTVQVQASDGKVDTASKYVDEVYNGIANRRW